MPVRVLVVDDSSFFRRRLTETLNADPQIEVIETAVDGKDAVAKAKLLKPDAITMDIEMPVMDGIEATRRIMQEAPTAILMFSSLTYEGARATLEALEAGATDFLPKYLSRAPGQQEKSQESLCARIKLLARQKGKLSQPGALTRQGQAKAGPAVTKRYASQHFNPERYDLIAIGTSTGGPVALQEVLTQLPEGFSLPILIVQHMPEKFTEAFANRLDQLCNIRVREAKDYDLLEPGVALVAPGGMQMLLEIRNGQKMVRIKEEKDPMQNYKPCVDVTFDSLAQQLGNRVLGIILTGMGADGKRGSQSLVARGSVIWAQDEASSTIYGMPAAVADLAEQILPLREIGRKLALKH